MASASENVTVKLRSPGATTSSSPTEVAVTRGGTLSKSNVAANAASDSPSTDVIAPAAIATLYAPLPVFAPLMLKRAVRASTTVRLLAAVPLIVKSLADTEPRLTGWLKITSYTLGKPLMSAPFAGLDVAENAA